MKRYWNMALLAFEQKVGWVMDGVDTVMNTRAPAVLIIYQKVTLLHDRRYFFSTLRLAMVLSPGYKTYQAGQSKLR